MDPIVHTIDEQHSAERLDRFIASMHPDVSRSEIQRDIRSGRVLVCGEPELHASRRLKPGESVTWNRTVKPPVLPRSIPLDIVYEDDEIVVVNKPVGLVVHPGAGTIEPTLVEGLLADRALPESDDPVRPGIVHRLDKDTSGILVVAKTKQAMASLKEQFSAREVLKDYLALAHGVFSEDEGLIEAPVGRDPHAPRRMAVQPKGRKAATEFRVLARLDGKTLLQVSPKTGRTHQIRVHLDYIRHAVVGDRIYGPHRDTTRLFLHAWRIVFTHPAMGTPVRFEAPVPEDYPEYPYEALPWRTLDQADHA